MTNKLFSPLSRQPAGGSAAQGTGRPQFEGEGSPSYAPVGARFSFANLAALQPVVDTDYRLLGWMRWEKTGVQAASNAAPKPEVLQTLRVQGYRWK